jgi:putative ABC transport system permease protein
VGDYREFQGRRLKVIGRTREAISFTTSPVAFLDYGLAQSLSPSELSGRTTFIVVRLAPGTDIEGVRREIRRRLPYNDVYRQDEWAARSRGYWIESTGLGLTIFLTVTLGSLVGVVIVAQTLYASTTEHLVEFGTVKALGGSNMTIYAIVAEQASFAAGLGFGLAFVLAHGLAPLLARFEMKMIVSPVLDGLVFVGTQVLCVGAASLSFRKVASVDPAIVFRG